LVSRARSALRLALHSPAGRSLLALLERLEPHRPNRLLVLTYHRVKDAPGFEAQMQHLANRYAVVSADAVRAARRRERPLPPRAVMITFDDAYRNFGEVAWPILRRLDLPVMLFVPTAYPDRPDAVFWWDRLTHAFRCTACRASALATALGPLSLENDRARRDAFLRLREHYRGADVDRATREVEELARTLGAPAPRPAVLSWGELRSLADAGVTLASHTRTHPPLHQLDRAAVRAEIDGSQADLTREIGRAPPLFAYPGGRYCEDAVAATRDAGMELAFTTWRGTNDLEHDDPLLLRRNNVGEQATATVLRTRLVQASARLNRWRPIPSRR